MTIPFALSVSHFINSVGAKAGFAAIIGLALLVLLFFAQMRETARLREDAQDAADHVAQLEQRLATLARGVAASGQTQAAQGQTAAAVAPRPASAAAAAAPPAVRSLAVAAQAPIAPAGLGAPALASATRMIPAFDDGPVSARRTGAAVPVAGAAGNGAQDGGGSHGGAAVMDPPGPPPATTAGGATAVTAGNGSGGRSPSPVGAPAPAPRPATGSRPPAPRNGGRPPASADRRDYRASGGGRGRTLLVAAIALLVVAVVVVVLLLLTSGGSGGSTSQTSSSPISNAPTKKHQTHRTTTIKPASVNVTVLNGTSTQGLAGDVTRKLQGDGYRLGTAATATDQTHTTTIVGYLPGHKAAAVIVAKSLGLGAGTVAAADQTSQAVACPQGSACTAQVIVTVGADLAAVASSSSAAAPAAGATSTG